MNEYSRKAIRDIFLIYNFYEYFKLLHKKSNLDENEFQHILSDNVKKLNESDYDDKEAYVESMLKLSLDIFSKTGQLENLLRKQNIELFFSILERALCFMYEDIIKSNNNLLISEKKTVNYKEIVQNENILDYIIIKECNSFSYSPICEKLNRLDNFLKIKNSFYKNNEKEVSNFNKIRQEIVHGKGNIKIDEKEYIKYFYLTQDCILLYDKEVNKYKKHRRSDLCQI